MTTVRSFSRNRKAQVAITNDRIKRFQISEEEKYTFDLQGYLIVRGALGLEEVANANAALEHYREQIKPRADSTARGAAGFVGESRRLELSGMLAWPEPQRAPFRQMLVHPLAVSRLNAFCGAGFRLDHGPWLLGATKGTEGHRLHGAATPFKPAIWYHSQNGEIHCRGVTVAWQLGDCADGDGGFCIIPGSHKSREPMPPELVTMEDGMGVVVQPAMQAGDVLFFAETAAHGALPWRADHERRSVLYKYASRAAARDVGRHFEPHNRYGDWVEELTREQRAVLFGPGSSRDQPLLESDGDRVWVKES
jgi:hypothetical protein